ncbi:glyoxalase [Bacillus glycinifermentans]|uniref:Glyoxalase n=1 Tax=Bacillus glycinifermentans TaxID=1664069 RepID=A0A0J6E2E6_9BACI|nr:VOC family protein [Bacillus glycinifermentans]ATH94391.1 VOC family protein [Bacillus glycinifermentans]KMM62965.1 glyoxalase [Bacillus glycinifermentans]KRT95816.1 glyoxalase [Bacillus glycinifermentans]MEC0484276.1 VOC family protein [Bacillus glycinifermentans]MEC0494426.1 VOC family protein [Bacillus glycinifermentans]
MKSANPYLFIDGCKEAIAFYQDALGGEVQNVQLADGIESFKGHEGKYLHAELHLGDSVIHFSDVFGKVTKGDHVSVTLECESEEEIRRAYEALKSGGQASLELQKTFWGALHANVTDKYGVKWLLNYQMPKS